MKPARTTNRFKRILKIVVIGTIGISVIFVVYLGLRNGFSRSSLGDRNSFYNNFVAQKWQKKGHR